VLNYIWLGLILLAVLLGGWNNRLPEVTEGAFDAAKTAVLDIALPLVGITALWLGMMRLAEKAGMIQSLARLLRRPLRRLFPDVPADHPAMGSMLMNMAANMIGLTNAATPLGLRAMQDLERLNPHPGTATNAMCTFLAINTSSLQLLPMTAISILAAKGSANPSAIVSTALLATACSTVVGITAVKLLERMRTFRIGGGPSQIPHAQDTPSDQSDQSDRLAVPAALPLWGRVLLAGFVAVFVLLFWRLLSQPTAGDAPANGFIRFMNAFSILAIPFFLAGLPLYAGLRRVPVYEEFVEGAREGFQVAVRIIPFLVAMLVAIKMFREAGGVELITRYAGPALAWIGFPSDLLPMALTRPLSGSATIGLFADLADTLGPDHLVTRMAATLLGSTETTLYVAAVYFGAVGIRRVRHGVAAGLLADLAGIIASVAICRLMWG
jgi:spore maturation protein SpmA